MLIDPAHAQRTAPASINEVPIGLPISANEEAVLNDLGVDAYDMALLSGIALSYERIRGALGRSDAAPQYRLRAFHHVLGLGADHELLVKDLPC